MEGLELIAEICSTKMGKRKRTVTVEVERERGEKGEKKHMGGSG